MLIALGRCLMSVIGGVAGLAVSLWFLIQRSLKEIDPGRLPSGDTMCGASICGIDVTAANQFVQSHFYVVLIAALVCAALGYASSYIFMPGESRKSSF